MWNVSEEFKRAVRGSHTRVTRAHLIRGGEVVAKLNVLSGSITIDENNTVERTLSLNVTENATGVLSDLAIRTAESPLAPYGVEIKVESGVRFRKVTEESVTVEAGSKYDEAKFDEAKYAEGPKYDEAKFDEVKYEVQAAEIITTYSEEFIEEMCPMGTFILWEVDVELSSSERSYRLVGYDRAKIVQGESENPVGIARDTLLTDAIIKLVKTRYPDFSTRFPGNSDKLLPLLIDDNADIWAEARKLAHSAGFRLHFDREGYLTLTPHDLFNAGIVTNYSDGQRGAASSISRRVNADDLYNVVVVVGTHSNLATPVRVVVQDNAPSSITRVSGPLGKRVKKISDERIGSAQQAMNMARAELARSIGATDEVNLRVIPDASLDVGDIIRVTSEQIGLVGRDFIVTRIQFPFQQELATLTARRTVLTEDGGVTPPTLV